MFEAVIIGLYTLEPMANILGEWVCVTSHQQPRNFKTFRHSVKERNGCMSQNNGIFFKIVRRKCIK